jgi:hypothetical protein
VVAKASLPSAIATQEQLAVWAIMALTETAPTQFLQERPGILSWYSEYQTVRSPNGELLFVGRVVIPLLEASALPSGAKPWLQSGVIPQGATVPAYYSAN